MDIVVVVHGLRRREGNDEPETDDKDQKVKSTVARTFQKDNHQTSRP